LPRFSALIFPALSMAAPEERAPVIFWLRSFLPPRNFGPRKTFQRFCCCSISSSQLSAPAVLLCVPQILFSIVSSVRQPSRFSQCFGPGISALKSLFVRFLASHVSARSRSVHPVRGQSNPDVLSVIAGGSRYLS
jgi:hypothetical protein